MSAKTGRSLGRRGGPGDLGHEIMADAANTKLGLVDGVHTLEAPPLLLHVSRKYDHLAGEQRASWSAEGERQARRAESHARRLAPAADAQRHQIRALTKTFEDATARGNGAAGVLQRHVQRRAHAALYYYVFLVLLLVGDVAGITGAAILFGEVVWVAAVQAVSVGAAMIVIGSLATEIEHARLARQRQKDDLSVEEQPYADFYRGTDPGEQIVRAFVKAAVVVVLFAAGGVCALRMAVEGTLAGVTFGCFSLVVGAGSWCNSYLYADDAADRLAAHRSEQHKVERALVRTAGRPALRQHERHLAEAQSIRREHELRGEAAARRVLAAGRQALIANPAVAGHGHHAPDNHSDTNGDHPLSVVSRNGHDVEVSAS